MKAVIITRPGGPEVLEVQDVAIPEPVGHQVRVRVYASGLNRADLGQRAGLYPAPPDASSDIPGLEFAGEIEHVGSLASLWKLGQRVMGLIGGGAQAEYVVIHEGLLLEIPANLNFVQAAAIPEVFMTAYDALFTQASLQPGESVLIHVVGSGVGTAAIQLAQAVSATVYGTARTAAKLEQAVSLGLDVPLLLPDFASEIQRLTAGRGVQVILDLLGADFLKQNMQSLSDWGRMVIVGALTGRQGEISLGLLGAKRISLKGVTMRSRTLSEKLNVVHDFANSVLPLFARNRVKPIVDRTYPLTEIRAAHIAMGQNEHFGKIILILD
jgi:NADPH:quinone reductase